MTEMAFDFLELSSKRTTEKPRKTGQTMIFDMGYGPGALRDQLCVLGPYIDLAKIAVGSARLYPRELLIEKADIYHEFGISPFLGGQFIEYVVTKHGFDVIPRFMQEAHGLGIRAVEVSDNCIDLTDDQRCDLIRMGVDAGLLVHGEVGSKDSKADVTELVRQSELMLNAGCEAVIFEAAELVDAGKPNIAMIEEIRAAVAPETTMIELPGPWIKGVIQNDVYEMMKLVLRTFGPDANIGNLEIDQVMELECTRQGLGTAGPNQIDT